MTQVLPSARRECSAGDEDEPDPNRAGAAGWVSFSCTGDYESEKGKPGSDGKKRIAVTLGVHTVPPDLYEYEQSRQRSRGAIEESGGARSTSSTRPKRLR